MGPRCSVGAGLQNVTAVSTPSADLGSAQRWENSVPETAGTRETVPAPRHLRGVLGTPRPRAASQSGQRGLSGCWAQPACRSFLRVQWQPSHHQRHGFLRRGATAPSSVRPSCREGTLLLADAQARPLGVPPPLSSYPAGPWLPGHPQGCGLPAGSATCSRARLLATGPLRSSPAKRRGPLTRPPKRPPCRQHSRGRPLSGCWCRGVCRVSGKRAGEAHPLWVLDLASELTWAGSAREPHRPVDGAASPACALLSAGVLAFARGHARQGVGCVLVTLGLVRELVRSDPGCPRAGSPWDFPAWHFPRRPRGGAVRPSTGPGGAAAGVGGRGSGHHASPGPPCSHTHGVLRPCRAGRLSATGPPATSPTWGQWRPVVAQPAAARALCSGTAAAFLRGRGWGTGGDLLAVPTRQFPEAARAGAGGGAPGARRTGPPPAPAAGFPGAAGDRGTWESPDDPGVLPTRGYLKVRAAEVKVVKVGPAAVVPLGRPAAPTSRWER